MKKLFLLLFLPAFSISCLGTDSGSTDKASENTDTIVAKEINNYESIEFDAADGLTISGNLYEVENPEKVILLCHQARFNKFEYEGIAQRLNEMGYTCLAIDQRSGGPIANRANETNIRAIKQGLGVDYLDAQADIKAGIKYLNDKYEMKIIVWGSSYSSTLILYEYCKNKHVEGAISFSPGNYFEEDLGSLVPMIAKSDKPLFLTSSKREKDQVAVLIENKELNDKQVQFVPEGSGHHGSRALWENQDGGEEYWAAIKQWFGKL